MAEKITLAELDVDIDGLLQKYSSTRIEIDALKKAQKLLQEQGKIESKQFSENEIKLKSLSQSYNQQKRTVSQLTDENSNLVTVEKALNNAYTKEIKTIEGARKNNKELLALRNKVNLSTKEGRDQADLLNKKLDENNKFIKENVSAYEQQKIGIGDYEGAIRKVFPAGGELMNVLGQIKTGLVSQKTALQATTAGTTGLTKASKLLRIALISTGIGAIVVALGTLVTAFQSTQKGADMITKALAPIKGAFEGIIGVVQDISLNVFSQLGDRFTIVSGGILNGIDKIRIGWNKLSGDTEEAEMLQARVEERTLAIANAQTSLNEKTSKLGEIWQGAGGRIKEAMESQKQIADLQIAIENAEIRLITQRARSMRIIKEQNKIGEDTTKTLEERTIAIEKANAESEKLLKAEQNIIDLKIRQTRIQQSQNDTDRQGQLELAQLQAEREDKKTQSLELQTTLQNKLNTVQKQAETELLKAEQEKVDLAIANAERELEIFKNNHQRKLDENKFFSEQLFKQETERLNKLEEQEKAFQLLRFQKGKITKQEYNNAIDEIDEEFRVKNDENEKLREEAKKEKEVIDLENKRAIDEENFLTDYEIKLERLETERQAELANAEKTGADTTLINQKYNKREEKLESQLNKSIVAMKSDAVGQIANILGEGSKVGQAIAVAQATMTGFEAVQNAYATAQKSPITIVNPAYPIIQAGIAGVQATANVAKVAGVKFEKGGLQEIGGRRHSSGGTKFVGEDGTRFEAERGELIGVMSRQASEHFMAFNNAFTSGSSTVGKYATGGIVKPTTATQNQEAGNNTQEFANILADRVNLIKPVLVVDDVTEMQGNKAEVVGNADI